MSASSPCKILLSVFLLSAALTMMADVAAVAQESPRELERVEVEAPQRRAASREPSDRSGSGYDGEQNPLPIQGSPGIAGLPQEPDQGLQRELSVPPQVFLRSPENLSSPLGQRPCPHRFKW